MPTSLVTHGTNYSGSLYENGDVTCETKTCTSPSPPCGYITKTVKSLCIFLIHFPPDSIHIYRPSQSSANIAAPFSPMA